jgi:solute carrier family 6 GABA transporter-like protein 1
MGFIVGHFLLVWCILGFVTPRWFDVFIIPERRDDWKQPMAPCVVRGAREAEVASSMEVASGSGSVHDEAKLNSATKDPRSDHLTSDNLNDSNSDPLFPDAPKRKQ